MLNLVIEILVIKDSDKCYSLYSFAFGIIKQLINVLSVTLVTVLSLIITCISNISDYNIIMAAFSKS